VYATIGLVLLLASETVQEARKRSRRKSLEMNAVAPPPADDAPPAPRDAAGGRR
jgi:hypothetical protein